MGLTWCMYTANADCCRTDERAGFEEHDEQGNRRNAQCTTRVTIVGLRSRYAAEGSVVGTLATKEVEQRGR